MRDKLGFEIPGHLEETWLRADKTGRDLCREIQVIYLRLEKEKAEHNPIFVEVTQSTIEDLKHIRNTLALIIPYCVCPYDLADEIKRSGCRACYSTGYLPKFRWDRCVPKDKKREHEALIAGRETAVCV